MKTLAKCDLSKKIVSKTIFHKNLKHKLNINQGILKGDHYIVDLLLDWFVLVCSANKNKNCKLSYS
jgi:hypothetical protein